MKKSELKSTVVYKVREINYLNGADFSYKGISNFHSLGSALECIIALTEKYHTSRDDYGIVEVKKIESLVTF